MRGSNHSIMNLVTAGFAGMTGFLVLKTDSPDFIETEQVKHNEEVGVSEERTREKTCKNSKE